MACNKSVGPFAGWICDHGDVEVERAGGWLVPLTSDAQIDNIIWLIDDRPAAVFWSCPDGEAAIHRHIRTINLVVVPLPHEGQPHEAPPQADTPPPNAPAGNASDAPAAPTLEDATVLFRHYDPNIMASLLPLLDPAQFARLFGPAPARRVMRAPTPPWRRSKRNSPRHVTSTYLGSVKTSGVALTN